MKMKLLLSCLMVLTMLFAAGCGGGEEAPPPEAAEKAPEPEKTPEQIAEAIKKDIAPLEQSFTSGMSEATAADVVNKLRAAKAANQTENGKIALERIASDVDVVVRQAKEQKRWKIVMAGIQAYDVLQPGTTKYQRLKELTELQLKKPKVKLKGFFKDVASNNQLYAFVEITDPVAGQTVTEQMREGEEKMGLKFTRIIGNQQGVEFEYLAIPGDVFEVKK